jgi:hypothetical protein
VNQQGFTVRGDFEVNIMKGINILGAVALAMRVASFAEGQVATPPMVGHWKGEASILVNWTKAKTLMVDLTIGADDHVLGTIGDARLVDGQLVSNRGWFGRVLRVKTDYRILAKLEGPIIAAEHVARESVSLPLTWKDGMFEGSLATSGTQFGGAESMILTAGKLVLRRLPDMIVCDRDPRPCQP